LGDTKCGKGCDTPWGVACNRNVNHDSVSHLPIEPTLKLSLKEKLKGILDEEASGFGFRPCA
jgi:hypothetical protein